MLSTLVELAAYAAFVVAGWLVTPFLGLAVLGVVLLLLAHALEGESGVKVKLPRVRMPKVRLPRMRMPKVSVTWPRPEATEP